MIGSGWIGLDWIGLVYGMLCVVCVFNSFNNQFDSISIHRLFTCNSYRFSCVFHFTLYFLHGVILGEVVIQSDGCNPSKHCALVVLIFRFN